MPKLLLLYVLAVLLVECSGLAVQTSSPPADDPQVRSQIAQLEHLLPHTSDRGAALFLLAKQYTRLGDLPKAFSLLKECISLDEGFDPSDSQLLKPLRSFPEFPQLVAQVHRRHPAVHRARVAFTVPETDLFPEGLAVDTEKNIFYMGSIHRKKIVAIDWRREVSDFVKPGLYSLLGLGGIKVDPADHSLWAASDNDHRSELLHFDQQGKLLERYSPTGVGPHVLNDLVLRGPRDIYVTDTVAQQVYRFDRAAHSFTLMDLPRPLFYPNGIALSADERQLYIADLMGVIEVDIRSNAAADVIPGPHNTLAGNDGLYWYKGSLLGVQYGTGTFRVMRWQLSPDGRRVTATQVLEYRTALVKDPTTGTIDRGKFYYIANTGIDNLENDQIVDPKKLEPVHIAVLELE
jgi:hypothetical protein